MHPVKVGKCPDGHDMLTTGEISRRIGKGFQMNSEFIEVELGVQSRDKSRRAILWWERDYDDILVKLINYLKEKRCQ